VPFFFGFISWFVEFYIKFGVIVLCIDTGRPVPKRRSLHIQTRDLNLTTNFVALVGKRTIPTERLPLVGEVSANFSG
jgi:hypothetical protein